MSTDLLAEINAALATVIDPEIHRPITELDMVESVTVDDTGAAAVTVLLTITGCPMANTIEADVRSKVTALPGITSLELTMSTMSDEQRAALKRKLRGGQEERDIPFAKAESRTQVLLISSGKGGVGKSSTTVNLAMALAGLGRSVGVLDADIYGHSIPQMLGLMEANPTMVEGMIMPVPSMGLKVISIGMLKESRDQVIAWRGPILDRALQQFLADVYWGDLDFLLVDLPPGTGDVALSLGQKLPNAEVIVVTTPQAAAAEVAERAGTMASMLNQKVIGVVENMAYLEVTAPVSGETFRVDVFGSGGGAEVASTLTTRLGYDVPLLAQVPIEPKVSASGDEGVPLVALEPERPAAAAIIALAEQLSARKPRLVGKSLGLTPLS
ncbi:MAG: sodium:proton antiporter [Actinobacteria bacterium HGW-Actinobacteria-2]|nr:MAG: sodium:proton antiporter [Actinobacteria bacterium HGW-Actinobacteria-2]